MTRTHCSALYRISLLLAAAAFLVAAVSGCGGGGGQVTAVSQTSPTPASPALSVVSVASQQILLNWTISPGATGYYIYRLPAFTSGERVNVGLLASFQDAALQNGTTYTYQVTGYNTTGESGKSPVQTATPQPPPSGTVSVLPSGVALSPGGTQAFTASVTGSGSAGVTYSIQEAGGGSITGGVYVAPSVTTTQVFHVVATSDADPTRQAIAAVVVIAPPPPVVQVGISPSSISLLSGGTQTFTASATGSSNTGVTYSVQEPTGGTINAGTGAYTAPSVTATQAFHVIATSKADPTRQSVASVAVSPPPAPGAPVAVSPSSVTIFSGQTISLGATAPAAFSSADAPAAIAADPSNPNGVIFTAPAVTSQTVYHVTATSADKSAATAAITVNPQPQATPTLSVSPKSLQLTPGITQTFTASLQNASASNSTFTWSIASSSGGAAAGSISSTSGGSITYTAASLPQTVVDVVTVAAVIDGKPLTDSATVVITPSTAPVTVTVNARPHQTK